MAGTAVRGRLTWRDVTIAEIRDETPVARTLVLDVPDWPGHAAGQHVDIKLIAEDGYSAERSYSIASASDGSRVELTVQRVPDGEVSSYLVDEARQGDAFEIRGPVGGYFTWEPDRSAPVLLVAGGSGVVPLMAMIRGRAATGNTTPFRLVYSVRDPTSVMYADELSQRARVDAGLEVSYLYTRELPAGWSGRPGRINKERLAEYGWAAESGPSCYVCGPTAFVEAVANMLVESGHRPDMVRTERFGPTGG
jgi:ferredoxin-NADP reductase